MSKLEEKIKAIMRGEVLAEDKDMGSLKKDEEDTSNAASKEAAKTAKEDNKEATDGEPEVGKGKKDKAEVKEGVIPELGKDLSGVGKQTSAGEDNSKGKLSPGAAPKLDSDGKEIKQPVKADSQDDAGDTAKIKKNLGQGDKTVGKLSSPMKEHISALFDGQELTEEFETKAEAIFEAAVADLVEARVAQIEEEYQLQVSEAVDEAKGELVERIDGFLDRVVEQWVEDNAVALESGTRVELVNSFIDGIKNVFVEHYVSVPEEKLDVVQEQAAQISEMEAELAALREEKENAEKQTLILRCEEILTDKAKGLTAIEEERFRSLVENVEFETDDEFAAKVGAIRESYFKKQVVESQEKTGALTEEKATYATPNAVLEALQKGKLKFVRTN